MEILLGSTGKYFGEKKILGSEYAERKTYLENPIAKVKFESGVTEEVTCENLSLGITEIMSDATTLRDKLLNPIVEKVMALLLESEIKVQDIEYLKSRITGNVNFHQKSAEDKLWGKDIYDITLADVNQIITNKKTNGRNKGSDEHKTKNASSSPDAGEITGQKGQGT